MIRTWTDDQIVKLHSMWLSGCTARTIGRSLGYSRNAVIGRLHRDGIKRPAGFKPEPQTKTLLLLNKGECHYPVNFAKENEPHLFCAKVISSDSPYCLKHHRVVYRLPKKPEGVAHLKYAF